jgi:CO/xanthine dehydrogenase Mo-binding subunit
LGKSVRKKGVGIATCWYGCGNTSIANPSTIRIGIRQNGQIILHQGATDIGQGSNTVITQIVADAIQTDIHSIELIGPDTDLTPDAGKTSASRQTFISGEAASLAGKALREKILRHANVGENARIKSGPTGLYIQDSKRYHQVDLCHLPLDEFGYVLSVQESYDPLTTPLDENGQGDPYALYGYGVQIAELTVDTELGTVIIDRITAAHDVGKAVNPTLVEGQIEGGIAQGIGLALMEEYQPGVTNNLHDYLIPTIGDMPDIDIFIVEDKACDVSNGIKGLGEHVLIPTAPAILNGIRNATGAKINTLPATPARVLSAMKEMGF